VRVSVWVARAAVITTALGMLLSATGPALAGDHPPVAILGPTQLSDWEPGAATAYDRATGQVVLYGGLVWGEACGCTGGGTWVLAGQDFVRVLPDTTSVYDAHLVFDDATGQLLRFGGIVGPDKAGTDETAVWTGTTWQTLHPAHVPPTRQGDAAAYDPATGEVIRFGGWDPVAGAALSDTWAWNGQDWVQLTPKTGAGPLRGASMAYDYATSQLVLFGGMDGSGAMSNQTMVWYRGSWVAKKTAPTGLTPRANTAMAYDPRTGLLQLWGGQTQVSPTAVASNQLWKWTASGWTLQESIGPNDTNLPSMVFDWAHWRMVLLAPYQSPSDHAGQLQQLGLLAAHSVTTVTPSGGLTNVGQVGHPFYLLSHTAPASTGGGALALLNAPGTVTFTVDGKPVPGCAALTVDSDSDALCAYTPTTATYHRAEAAFTPDPGADWIGSYVGSRSKALVFNVTA
jgi:hypothetical protein